MEISGKTLAAFGAFLVLAALLLFAASYELSHPHAVAVLPNSSTEEAAPEGAAPVPAGDIASDFKLEDAFTGQTVSLASLKGKVVFLNVWATWCGPCREEVPGLAGVAGEFGPKGLAVVGVSLDDGRDVAARVQQFVSRYRVPYPIAFPAPVPRSLGPGDSVIPTTILLDRQGRVVKRYVGAVERGDFARDVTALLAEN